MGTIINVKKQGTEKRTMALYRCPECKVKDAYYRSKTDDYVCRTCGCIFEILSDVPE